jgi:hypothetical protein
MPISSRLSLRYPDSADTADVPRDLGYLASDIDDAVVYGQGNTASRPVSTAGTNGIPGRVYRDTTLGVVYWDTGSSWVEIGTVADGSITSAKILDGTIVAGDIANATITSAKLAAGVAGTLLTVGSVTATTERATTSSGTWADITSASFSITVGSNSVTLIGLSCELKSSSNWAWAGYAIGSIYCNPVPSTSITGGLRGDEPIKTFDATYSKRSGQSMIHSSQSGTGAQTVKAVFSAYSSGETATVKNVYLSAVNIPL